MAASPKRWLAAAHQGIDPQPAKRYALFATLMLHQKHKHVVNSLPRLPLAYGFRGSNSPAG
ncbi:hypothetical protein E2C01_044889 [Portunus trituberculatus]|uniref:Uncharacterized protein n=1 Tax=Portunus trituberculatus TaxID=210409 RepID=A0A5B7FWS8_PORTR|nr:hypothetical protein [Portunus trituberculatus]